MDLLDVKSLTRQKVQVILYDNLTINDDILNLLSKDGRALLLFPTGAGADGHWIAILFNSNTRVLEHWDSYALTVTQEMTYSRNPNVEQNILGKLYQKTQQQHGILPRWPRGDDPPSRSRADLAAPSRHARLYVAANGQMVAGPF